MLGAYGFLGNILCRELKKNGYDVLRQGRMQESEYCVDPLSETEIEGLIENANTEAIVNLIAKTDVDGCEGDVNGAFLANVAVLEVLERILAKTSRKPHLIHLSTDQVYSGPGPHSEKNVNPLNVYGLSKYTGELVAGRVDATILRLNFVGKSYSKNRPSFTDWVVSSLRNEEKIYAFDDVHFNPVHTSHVVDFIQNALVDKAVGVYNLGSTSGLTKADFIFKLAELLNLDQKLIEKRSAGKAELIAKRPSDMTMSTCRLAQRYKCIPTIQETIALVAEEYL